MVAQPSDMRVKIASLAFHAEVTNMLRTSLLRRHGFIVSCLALALAGCSVQLSSPSQGPSPSPSEGSPPSPAPSPTPAPAPQIDARSPYADGSPLTVPLASIDASIVDRARTHIALYALVAPDGDAWK